MGILSYLRSLFSRPLPAQPVVSTVKKAGPAVLIAAAAFITPWEGLMNKAYLDPVGIPTICIGHIEDVKLGDYKTTEECKQLLADDLPKYQAMVRKCVPGVDRMPVSRQVALISFTYNVGGGALCKSSVARELNAGNVQKGCDALLRYNKAGRPLRELRGLTNRRIAERQLCLKDK